MNQQPRLCVTLTALLLLCPFAGTAAALDPSSTDPRAVLDAMRSAASLTRASSRVHMLIQDKSGKRERVFTTRARKYDDAIKTLLVIEQPADLHNMGFLTIDYSDRGHSDEQWMYLPKLKRVSRVPESGKSDSFVGSDFSISDLATGGTELDDFELRMAEQSVKVGDDDCWLIETKPRNAQVRDKTGYERSQLWISKSKLIVMQFKGWTSDGKKTKYLKALEVRKEQGVWGPRRTQMRTLVGDQMVSETQLEVLNIDNDAKDVVDSDFTVQRLEHGA